jgi:enamine deaminase RidA (YjgF/YER057c/UK114 family)
MTINQRLKDLNVVLPTSPKNVGSYAPYVVTGNRVFISGQLPMVDGEIQYAGQINDESVVRGQAAARLCSLNILAQLRDACGGDLDKVKRCIKLGGFMNCEPAFTKHPMVIDGASNLMIDVFGDKIGSHARIAIGVNSLPVGAAVEVEAIFEIEAQ